METAPRALIRVCYRCKQPKDVSLFSKKRRSADGINQYCKLCMYEIARAWNLRKQFNMTLEQYDKLLQSQEGRCAICRRLPAKNNLSVDHDHDTGAVRGLLCPPCNRSVEWMIYNGDRAKEYLDGSKLQSKSAGL